MGPDFYVVFKWWQPCLEVGRVSCHWEGGSSSQVEEEKEEVVSQ